MKLSSFVVMLAGFAVAPLPLSASTNNQSTYAYKPVLDQDFVIPRILGDPETKISYFLDSDGRHISAVSPDGKLLWRVDPFVDAKLDIYRTSSPIILDFQVPDEAWWGRRKNTYGDRSKFILIGYNSSQFGILRKSSGQFIYMGED